MGKFSITGSVLNSESAKQIVDGYKITYVPIDKIIINDFNFYSVEDVSDLRDAIEQFGLQQPLVVTKDGENYKLISGHRRFKAISEIHAADADKFSEIPCHLAESRTPAADKLALITANSTARELTDYEKMEQVRLTKEILVELKAEGFQLSGRQRDIIADELKMSATQVQRLDFINKNLIDEYKEKLQADEISISVADELSHLSDEQQKEIYEESAADITIEDVKTVRAASSAAEPQKKKAAKKTAKAADEADTVAITVNNIWVNVPKDVLDAFYNAVKECCNFKRTKTLAFEIKQHKE